MFLTYRAVSCILEQGQFRFGLFSADNEQVPRNIYVFRFIQLSFSMHIFSRKVLSRMSPILKYTGK